MKNPTSVFSLGASIVKNHQLIWQMTKRNVVGKYKGSFFGLLWSLFNPLIMLSIYTFAFSVVFKAKWGIENEGHLDFALILFASLTIFNFFGEVLGASPTLIVSQPNYVKKVIFPLEILPVISLFTSLVHTGISILIFIVFFGVIHLSLPWTLLLLPFIFLPLMLMTLGISYFMASLGVYLRDVGYLIGHIVQILLFTSPVFYSLERLPVVFQKFLILNPIAYILENSRKVMIFGQTPDWIILGYYTVFGIILVITGYWWFQKTRKGFADVL
jgi:lipopolysaccharide transport system permease protein